ncbi:MAG: Na+:solute symporter [Candidatus Omnitrophota bacterium]|jgi:Na+/proline symporter|nr:MAG: Na+:solute symporter [Candidatus Omnitrophota bacterium]
MLLNSVDWMIVALYFIFVLLMGLIFARRAGRNIDEYFVSGRNLPWWLVGTSMVATTFATDTPMLITNLVRTRGVSGNWAWWAFLLTGMVTVFLYAKLWRRSGVLTDIGFYELRYSGKAAAFLRGFRAVYLGFVFNVILMAIVTLAAVKISGVLLGLNKYTTVLICGLITAIYSSTAGLWGVVVTDLFLFVMAMTGSIGAAYYAVSHEKVGGLSGLLSHPEVVSFTHMLPDFTRWEEAIPIFIIPFAVQWWSVWYPGAEPGGGGFVAQRMLAAKDEEHSLLATLWFNVAHYAVRPWPWIIVALCSMIVYPTLDSIQQQFPALDGNLIAHDLAYPAMLILVPHGMLGLVIASLAAAYMSTISTCLNWGASYLTDDFYRRFIRPNADPQHYVRFARSVTVLLMAAACLFSFLLGSALQGFEILLQIGAGTGLIFLLRWFWWRVNAYSEITAMIVSFLIALYFKFVHADLFGLTPLPSWQELIIGVALTTACWLTITFITPMTDRKVLQNFYDKIRPMGRGWAQVVDTSQSKTDENLSASILCVFLGCLAVYCALFATGFILYGNYVLGGMLSLICVFAVGVIFKFRFRFSPKQNS